MINRRHAIGATLATAALASFPAWAAVSSLTSLTNNIVPIGKTERVSRLAKAQSLMRADNIGAILIEPSASLTYCATTGCR